MGTVESAQRSRRTRIAREARRAATAALLALVLGSGAPARAAEPTAKQPTLESLMRGMASTSGVVAHFREVKELGLLSAPLETRGILHFVPPDRLARQTLEPSRSRLVIDGERVAYRDEAGDEVADLSSSPLAQEFVKSFIVLFNGDLETLRERYEPELRVAAGGEAPARWTLVLRPRHRPLADVIEHITLEGRGRVLERIALRETDGDRSITTFEDVEVDRRFDPDELERIFRFPENAPAAP